MMIKFFKIIENCEFVYKFYFEIKWNKRVLHKIDKYIQREKERKRERERQRERERENKRKKEKKIKGKAERTKEREREREREECCKMTFILARRQLLEILLQVL